MTTQTKEFPAMFKMANRACTVVMTISDDLESVYRDMASCVTSNSIFKKRVLIKGVKVLQMLVP